MEASIASGLVNESEPARTEFTVVSAKMQVRLDSKVDTKTQAEIQRNMQEEVLESNKYPEIRFRSSRVEKQSMESRRLAEPAWRDQADHYDRYTFRWRLYRPYDNLANRFRDRAHHRGGWNP